jgi:hypothetical protein
MCNPACGGNINVKSNAMSFADPQSITIDSVAVSLPRTGSGDGTGEFTSSDGTVKLTVATSNGKRNRHTIRIDHSKVAPDPFASGVNTSYSMSTYIVVDVPLVGYTLTEAQEVVDAFTTFLTSSSSAAVTKLLGGEN